MANKKYTELPQANAITGAEILAMVQDGDSVQGDIDLIKAYFDTLYPTMVYTSPVAWTPTVTGFGTVSGLTARWWRTGSFMHGQVRFVCGTNSVATASFTLPNSVATASTYPTLAHVGTGSMTPNFNTVTVLAEASSNIVYLGAANANSLAGLAKRAGNAIAGTGEILSFYFCVEISGW